MTSFHLEGLRQTAAHRKPSIACYLGDSVYRCCPPNCCPSECSKNECACPPRKSRSRELKMGYLISKCDCLYTNGLQDDCKRTGCGTPYCLLPEPLCCPSMARARNESCLQPRLPPCCCCRKC